MAGHYRKRGKESYELIYRSNSKTIKAKNETQVERALAAFIVDVDKGKFKKPNKLTVEQFINQRWIRDYVEPNLAPNTTALYKRYLKNRIIPVLGDIKLDKVKPEHLLDFYANLREEGIREDGKEGALSPATIQKHHVILSSMFRSAVEWQIIEENPCDRVRAPKVPKRKPFSLDAEQSANLIENLAKEPLKYRVISAIGILTGMRRGEILGLSWKNTDLDNLVFKINQTCQVKKGGAVIRDFTKNEKSERIIPFPENLVPLLKEYKAIQNKKRLKCGDKWIQEIEINDKMVKNDLVFTQWDGKPMHPNAVDTWFHKFKTDNSLPDDMTFHGLRHTNITLLLINGVDVGTVADNSGHAKKSTTLDIYQGSIPRVQRTAADKMGTLLGDNISDLLNQPVNPRRKKKEKIN